MADDAPELLALIGEAIAQAKAAGRQPLCVQLGLTQYGLLYRAQGGVDGAKLGQVDGVPAMLVHVPDLLRLVSRVAQRGG